jgi:hypothetical protein
MLSLVALLETPALQRGELLSLLLDRLWPGMVALLAFKPGYLLVQVRLEGS